MSFFTFFAIAIIVQPSVDISDQDVMGILTLFYLTFRFEIKSCHLDSSSFQTDIQYNGFIDYEHSLKKKLKASSKEFQQTQGKF